MSELSEKGMIDTLKNEGNRGAAQAAVHIIENASRVKKLIAAVGSNNKRLKNAAIKTLRIVADSAPEILYPHTSVFKSLLESEDNILKWNATYIICDMARIDDGNKIDSDLVDRLIDQLYSDVLITASNTASAIWKIALYKPDFKEKIKSYLIRVDQHERDRECKAILAGKAIEALDELLEEDEAEETDIAFACRHLESIRPATRKKALSFLKKHEDQST